MTLLRAAARTMLASYFVASGVKALRDPDSLVPAAEPLIDQIVPLVKQYAPGPGRRLRSRRTPAPWSGSTARSSSSADSRWPPARAAGSAPAARRLAGAHHDRQAPVLEPDRSRGEGRGPQRTSSRTSACSVACCSPRATPRASPALAWRAQKGGQSTGQEDRQGLDEAGQEGREARPTAAATSPRRRWPAAPRWSARWSPRRARPARRPPSSSQRAQEVAAQQAKEARKAAEGRQAGQEGRAEAAQGRQEGGRGAGAKEAREAAAEQAKAGQKQLAAEQAKPAKKQGKKVTQEHPARRELSPGGWTRRLTAPLAGPARPGPDPSDGAPCPDRSRRPTGPWCWPPWPTARR